MMKKQNKQKHIILDQREQHGLLFITMKEGDRNKC